MTRQQFLNGCSEATTTVLAADLSFSAWLSSIGIAYSDAWKTHTDFIKAMGSEAKLTQDILLGAALAFIPGAMGGALSDVMKISKEVNKDTWLAASVRNNLPAVADVMIDLRAGTPTIDGIKDLAKWGWRNPDLTGLTVPVGDAYKKFPTDPLVWQNSVNERVKTELANVTRLIVSWEHAANTNDKRFVCNFDPAKKVREALYFVPKKVRPIGPVSIDITYQVRIDTPGVSKFFQAGFLTTWIDKCVAKAKPGQGGAMSSWDGWSGRGGLKGDIVDYGKRLGLKDIEAFIRACEVRDHVDDLTLENNAMRAARAAWKGR